MQSHWGLELQHRNGRRVGGTQFSSQHPLQSDSLVYRLKIEKDDKNLSLLERTVENYWKNPSIFKQFSRAIE